MTFELTDSIKNDIMFAMEDQNSQSAFNAAENKVVSFIKNFDNTAEDLKIDENKVYSKHVNLDYDYLIIATGGVTIPQTGSNGSGHKFSSKLGHTITEILPAEVPLVSDEPFIKDRVLQGLSFSDVGINVVNKKGRVRKSLVHDLLITHFGLSGPGALRASFFCLNLLNKEGYCDIVIDFIPNTKVDDTLDLKEVTTKSEIPKRLINFIKEDCTSDLEVLEKLKKFKVNIKQTRSIKHAFVTNGGINLKEVDPKTLKSKINPKISFCGEVLDLNAYTGGFNITTAFTTGYTAGQHILN